MYIFRSISRLASCKWNREAPSFHKFQQFINWLQKSAAGNGNLQPEIEINEYSSSKKLLYQYSSTRNSSIPWAEIRKSLDPNSTTIDLAIFAQRSWVKPWIRRGLASHSTLYLLGIKVLVLPNTIPRSSAVIICTICGNLIIKSRTGYRSNLAKAASNSNSSTIAYVLVAPPGERVLKSPTDLCLLYNGKNF